MREGEGRAHRPVDWCNVAVWLLVILCAVGWLSMFALVLGALIDPASADTGWNGT